MREGIREREKRERTRREEWGKGVHLAKNIVVSDEGGGNITLNQET